MSQALEISPGERPPAHRLQCLTGAIKTSQQSIIERHRDLSQEPEIQSQNLIQPANIK